MRNTTLVTIDAEGRDRLKVFRLSEMAPEANEEWLGRLILLAMKMGLQLSAEDAAKGLPGLLNVGPAALSRLSWANVGWEDVRAVLDLMSGCIEFGDGRPKALAFRALRLGDIEEAATLARLRVEVLKMQVVSMGAGPGVAEVIAARMRDLSQPAEGRA